jgi:RING finger and CHY zinc finger domain-containing protein 1
MMITLSCLCAQFRNNCEKCGIQFGEYHCNTCNLWMSVSEQPYHCVDCGFCRVGGRDNFTHCHACGMCIDAFLFDDHNCKAGKYLSNCPVCQEDLFSSRCPSHEMPCGHAIHWHCFRELTAFDTRCPVCKKTAESHEIMAETWSSIAMGIKLQPIPPEMSRVVNISCVDCGERDENRRWHFLGVQCLKCTSFNTTIENTLLFGMEAAAALNSERQFNPPSNLMSRIMMHEETSNQGVSRTFWGDESANTFRSDSEEEFDHEQLLFSLALRTEPASPSNNNENSQNYDP